MATWSEAFDAYLKSRGISQQDAMLMLRLSGARVTQSQVSYWCRGALPRAETRELIERWTKGVVPAHADASRHELVAPRSEERSAKRPARRTGTTG